MKRNRYANRRGLVPVLVLLAITAGMPARQSEAAPGAAGTVPAVMAARLADIQAAATGSSPYAAALNLNGSSCNPSPVGVADLVGLNPGSQVVYAQAKTGLYRVDAGSSNGWVLANARISGLWGIAPSANNPNDVLLQHDTTLMRSMDGGATSNVRIMAAASDPFSVTRAASDPATLYALSVAGASGSGPESVFRSSNTGISWTQVYSGGTNLEGDNLLSTPVVAPSDARTVALIEDADHGGSLDYTADGGLHWNNPDGSGQPDGLLAPTTFTFNPANARDIWVEYQPWQIYPGNTLAHTRDGGKTWQQVSSGLPPYADIRAIAVDPRGLIYVALAGNSTGVPNPLFVAPDAKHFVRLLPAGNPNVGHALALASGYAVLLTWDFEHPLWAITTNRPGGFDPLKDAASAPAGSVYVAATHHAIAGAFLTFYTRHGGLRSFGLPLSEPLGEHGTVVQYFERARLALAGQTVTPTPIGSMDCAGRVFPRTAAMAETGTRRYFGATGHSLSRRFLTYWQQHEGSLLLGAPISEPLHEQNGDGSGRPYLLQYFANGRLEYHPELGAGHDVSLGLVGGEYLHRAGLR